MNVQAAQMEGNCARKDCVAVAEQALSFLSNECDDSYWFLRLYVTHFHGFLDAGSSAAFMMSFQTIRFKLFYLYQTFRPIFAVNTFWAARIRIRYVAYNCIIIYGLFLNKCNNELINLYKFDCY